jgi:hypothetical protein
MQQKSAAMRRFDHLVGAQKERLRDREAKRLGSFEIDSHLKFGRQLNR